MLSIFIVCEGEIEKLHKVRFYLLHKRPPLLYGEGGRQGCLKFTIHASSALKSTFHMLSYTKSKSTHTKLKNEEGKPENTTFILDTFQCCDRNIFTVYFLSDFTQIKARSRVQHFLAQFKEISSLARSD